MKPYFQDDAVTLYCSDCREILPGLGKFDLLLTDPPYGTTQNEWDEPFFDFSLFGDVGKIVFSAQPYTSLLVTKNLKDFKYETIWEKSKATGFLDCKKRPLRSHENILFFGNIYKTYNAQRLSGEPWFRSRCKRPKSNWGEQKENISKNESGDREPRSVVRFSNPNYGSLHPTQKPIALVKYLILTYSNNGETILDPFAGSGTTGRAAKDLGRKCVMIEREERYCEIAAKRMSQQVLNFGERETDED